MQCSRKVKLCLTNMLLVTLQLMSLLEMIVVCLGFVTLFCDLC